MEEGDLQSAARVVATIQYLREHENARLSEIAERLAIHKSNALRLLTTLERHAWIERDQQTHAFRLGPGLVPIGFAARDARGLAQRLQKVMEELRDLTRETVHLGVFDGSAMLHIARTESPEFLRVVCPPGTRDRLHTSGLGKAYMAALPERERHALVSTMELTRWTAHTTTNPDTMLGELALSAERGYALDEEEGRDGVRCVGLAVCEPSGYPIASLSITGPAARWSLPRMAELMPELLAAFGTGVERAGFTVGKVPLAAA